MLSGGGNVSRWEPWVRRRLKLSARTGWASAAAVVLLLLYMPVFTHAMEVWATDQEFSFGFLAPPLTLALLWMRRGALRASLGSGSNLGLLVFVGGLLMLVASARIGVHTIGGASFAVTALGATAYLYGLSAARTLFFPAIYLTVGLSLYRGLLGSLGFVLQEVTARYAAISASIIGVPVQRVGVDLFAGHFHFVVAEACSGLSSLLALLSLGLLIVGLAQASLARRLLLISLVVPIVLVANIARVTLVVTLAQVFGAAVAEGFIHSLFSAVLFLVALGLLFIVGGALKCLPRISATA